MSAHAGRCGAPPTARNKGPRARGGARLTTLKKRGGKQRWAEIRLDERGRNARANEASTRAAQLECMIGCFGYGFPTYCCGRVAWNPEMAFLISSRARE